MGVFYYVEPSQNLVIKGIKAYMQKKKLYFYGKYNINYDYWE